MLRLPLTSDFITSEVMELTREERAESQDRREQEELRRQREASEHREREREMEHQQQNQETEALLSVVVLQDTNVEGSRGELVHEVRSSGTAQATNSASIIV